ncbi:tetratricopeptide repeat protein [Pontixanthobacter aestiaquae]|uniref:Sel1 repeat family protein n=1 Tax=Pontixanthobacter aestiaquae TaxID=1509367 RepID=A0A844Z8W1_9SPHN|nr:tetratricopeptide repeat protein [Pontixanthobacter aestiaquae]MDN3645256.1 tetratricopeptide repeat protein [Pontixanthobacter aestiaquae]MXO83742.1 hypothetical protein [Pontixanthobacter aestiaquae]
MFANAPLEARESQLIQLEKLAEQDNAEATYHLGMMHLTGTGVDLDRQRAVGYFEKATELGDPLAAYKLGCFYDGQYQLFAVDLELALKYKMVAADAGYASAQQDVAGLLARNGAIDEALVWLERAAAQGTAGALQTYASVHNGALGVEKDPVKTAAYFDLYLRRIKATSEQRKWLERFKEGLTEVQVENVERLILEYVPKPTPLTRKALSGQRAVDALLLAS